MPAFRQRNQAFRFLKSVIYKTDRQTKATGSNIFRVNRSIGHGRFAVIHTCQFRLLEIGILFIVLPINRFRQQDRRAESENVTTGLAVYEWFVFFFSCRC